MALSLRQKITAALLVIYWIILFFLAHRPIPQWLYDAHVSDKSIHFIAYLLLVFLLWFAIRPDAKVNWCKGVVWWVVFVMALYSAVDEVTQGYVGRQCDFADFLANIAGVLAGLILFTFLSFWPGLLAVTSITIFGVTNLAKANVSELMPVSNTVFHIVAYAGLTVVWLRVMKLPEPRPRRSVRWLAVAVGVPIAFLLFVKASSVALGRYGRWNDVVVSVAAIAAVVVAEQLRGLMQRVNDSANQTHR